MLSSTDFIRHIHSPDLAKGVLGFSWGMSRDQVFALLPESARHEAFEVGAQFFTRIAALVESTKVHVHFQFAQGLTGVTVTPLVPVDPESDLRQLLGDPSATQDTNRGIFRMLAWPAETVTVVLSEAGVGEVSITYRLTSISDPPRPQIDGREVELEDLVPSVARIQYHIDRDEPEQAATLELNRRLGLGWCPRCAFAIETWHRRDCPLRTKEQPCATCGRPSELQSSLCLGCGQREYIRFQLATVSIDSLHKQHDIDNALRLDRGLKNISPDLHLRLHGMAAANRRTDRRFRDHFRNMLFAAIAVLVLIRVACSR